MYSDLTWVLPSELATIPGFQTANPKLSINVSNPVFFNSAQDLQVCYHLVSTCGTCGVLLCTVYLL